MKKDGYYSSGEFAKMADVTLRTIRYYDRQNLLKPSYVNEHGARFYTDSDFVKLQQILLFKFLGFSLSEIRDMTLNHPDRHVLLDSLDIQLKLVKDRREQLQLMEQTSRHHPPEKRGGLETDDGFDSYDLHGKKFKKPIYGCLEH